MKTLSRTLIGIALASTISTAHAGFFSHVAGFAAGAVVAHEAEKSIDSHHAQSHTSEQGYTRDSGTANGDGNPGESRLYLNNVQATVNFSPDGGCERAIVQAINEAHRQVLVQAYGFTDKAILKALVEAKQRGLDVRVILDKSNETQRYSGATYVMNAGIPVWIDYEPAIAHNKIMVIDNDEVITGSFNFTTSAQKRNAENVLILNHAPQLAAVYVRNWQWRLGQSRQFGQ